MTETLADELAAELEDDSERRTLLALADIRQTHLSARWWS